MFPLQPSVGRARPSQVPTGTLALVGHSSFAASMLRFGLLAALFAAILPAAASAQGLGTMQVTARVVPGEPSWAGLTEVQALTRQVPLTPSRGAEVRRAGLVQARAALASTVGPRRLLITIDYPRN